MFNRNHKEKTTDIKEFPVVFGGHGLKLKGKIILPKDASANKPVPGAVLCHGFGSAYRVMEPSAQIMAAQGIATLIFDFRGHGSSEGAVDGKMADDVVDAWNLLSQLPEVDSKRMGLVGHSLGAISVIMAAERVNNPRVLQKLEDCSKLFVFCEGDKVTPYRKFAFIYETACQPKELLLTKGGFHTTPLLRGNLRSQWTSWTVKALTDIK
jgi:cephalosporin-C deacetylase-like acetyl esterase